MAVKARIILTILCAAGSMELLISRVNLSFAIVKMVQIVSLERGHLKHRNSSVPFCFDKDDNKDEPTQSGEFKRNFTLLVVNNNAKEEEIDYPLRITSVKRGMILSAFFYLYGISCAFGGVFVDKFGAKKIFGIIVLVDSIGNFCIPIAAKTHYGLLIFIRIVMGIFQGAGFPCFFYLGSLWIPEREMSRFLSFVIPANSFGPVFIFNVGAALISEFGWEYVFYLSGFMGCVFVVLWTVLIYDTPEEHIYISERERKYIIKERKRCKKQNQKVPYKSMAKSLPLWANIVAHCGNMGGVTIFQTQLPIYMDSIIGVKIKRNGFLSSVPFLARYISANSVSWISVSLIKKSKWSTKTWYRIITAVGFWSNGLCILLVGYVKCNTIIASTLLIMAMIFSGFTPSGYQSNLVKISPQFPGISFGALNLFAFSYSLLGPLIVGALTPQQTLDEWTNVFWIVFINYFLSGLFFIFFVSTKVQPWNYGSDFKLSNGGGMMENDGNEVKSELVQPEPEPESRSEPESRLEPLQKENQLKLNKNII